ncbi:hypothetical protein GCM10027259_02160 [Micromonospora palomenae]
MTGAEAEWKCHTGHIRGGDAMSGGALPGTRRPRSDARDSAVRGGHIDRDGRHIYLFVTSL